MPESPNPIHPEPAWGSPGEASEKWPYIPAAFDSPPLNSREDAVKALRGWACDVLYLCHELVCPDSAGPQTARGRALTAALCDLERLLGDAADVLDGQAPPAWEALQERDRAELRQAAREILRNVDPKPDDAGRTMLALRSLGLAEDREGAR